MNEVIHAHTQVSKRSSDPPPTPYAHYTTAPDVPCYVPLRLAEREWVDSWLSLPLMHLLVQLSWHEKGGKRTSAAYYLQQARKKAGRDLKHDFES